MVACPPGSTSALGATSVDDCYCADPNSGFNDDQSACICNPGYATPSNTVNPADGACALHLCGANHYPIVHGYHEVATILGKKKANGCQDPSSAAILADTTTTPIGATFSASDFKFFEPSNLALGDNGHILYVRSANSIFKMDLRLNLVERLLGRSNTVWAQALFTAGGEIEECGDEVPVVDSDYTLMVVSPDNNYMYASKVGTAENIARIDINPYSPKYRCATNFVGSQHAGTDDGVGSNAKFQYIYGGDMSKDGSKIVTFSQGKGTVRLVDVATATVSTLAGGGSNKATKKSNAASPLSTAEHAAAYDGVGSNALFRDIKQTRFSHDGSTVYVMDDYYMTTGHTKNVLRKIDVNTATVTTIFSPNAASQYEYMPEFVVMNTGNLAVMLYKADTLFGTGSTTVSGIVEFEPDGTYVQVLMDMQSSAYCSVSSAPCCADGDLATARLGYANTGSAMAMSDTTLYIADFSMDTVRTLELPGAYCQTCPYLSGSSPGITTVDQCAYPPCDANFFGPGGLDCHACPPGSTSVQGSNAVLSDCICTDPNAAPNAIGTICTCNAGYTGPDGGSCTACTGNTFKQYPGSQPCDACPERSTSPDASVSVDACSCNANTYTGDIDIFNAQEKTGPNGYFAWDGTSDRTDVLHMEMPAYVMNMEVACYGRIYPNNNDVVVNVGGTSYTYQKKSYSYIYSYGTSDLCTNIASSSVTNPETRYLDCMIDFCNYDEACVAVTWDPNTYTTMYYLRKKLATDPYLTPSILSTQVCETAGYENYHGYVKNNFKTPVPFTVYNEGHCLYRTMDHNIKPYTTNMYGELTFDGYRHFIGSTSSCDSTVDTTQRAYGWLETGVGAHVDFDISTSGNFHYPRKLEKSTDGTKIYVLSVNSGAFSSNLNQGIHIHEINLVDEEVSIILTQEQTYENMGGGAGTWYDMTLYRRHGVDYLIVTAESHPCMYNLNLKTYDWSPMDECSQSTDSGQNTRLPDGGGVDGYRHVTAVAADNTNDRIFVIACAPSGYSTNNCEIQLVSWSTDGSSSFTTWLRGKSGSTYINKLLWQSGNLEYSHLRNELYWNTRYSSASSSYGAIDYWNDGHAGYLYKLDLTGCLSLTDCTNVEQTDNTINLASGPINMVDSLNDAGQAITGGTTSWRMITNLRMSLSETILFVAQGYGGVVQYGKRALALGSLEYSVPGCPACPEHSTSAVGATDLSECSCASNRYLDYWNGACTACPTNYASSQGSIGHHGCALSCPHPRWTDTTAKYYPTIEPIETVQDIRLYSTLQVENYLLTTQGTTGYNSYLNGKIISIPLDDDYILLVVAAKMWKMCMTCDGGYGMWGEAISTLQDLQDSPNFIDFIGADLDPEIEGFVDGVGLDARIGYVESLVMLNDKKTIIFFDKTGVQGSWSNWALRSLDVSTGTVKTLLRKPAQLSYGEYAEYTMMAHDPTTDDVYWVHVSSYSFPSGRAQCHPLMKITPRLEISEVKCFDKTQQHPRGIVFNNEGSMFIIRQTATSSEHHHVSMLRDDGSFVDVMQNTNFIWGLHYSSRHNALYFTRQTGAIEMLRLDNWNCPKDSTGSCTEITNVNGRTLAPSCDGSDGYVNDGTVATGHCRIGGSSTVAGGYNSYSPQHSQKMVSYDQSYMVLHFGSASPGWWYMKFVGLGHAGDTTPRCGACPASATTPAGIDSYDDCVCGNNGEEVITTADPPVCQCGAGWNTQSDGTCDAKCGVGDYPSTAQGTTVATFGAQSATNLPLPLNGPGKNYGHHGYNWDRTNRVVSTTGDGVGTDGHWTKPVDVAFLDNSNALFLDDTGGYASCIRKVTIPSTVDTLATITRWASLCSVQDIYLSTDAHGSKKYWHGYDGVTTGGDTPTGILGNHPRAMACTPDGAYCYVILRHTPNWVDWANTFGGANPQTGLTGNHYASAQVVRIRSSDRYITHLTKIHWSTSSAITCGGQDANPDKSSLGCMFSYAEKFGMEIHPISKKLIISVYNTGKILALDVESLLTSCTTVGTYGALSYCAESEVSGFVEVLATIPSAVGTLEDLAITPNGRIFAIKRGYHEDTLYALSENSFTKHDVQGGGEGYHVTKVAEFGPAGFYTQRLLPWNNNKLIMCVDYYTSPQTSYWWYVDISDESSWPFEVTLSSSSNAAYSLFEDYIPNLGDYKNAFPNSHDGVQWTSAALYAAGEACGISPDHTFMLAIEQGYSNYRERIIGVTLGEHTYDYAVCADCPTDTTSPAGSVDVTDCVNPCDANFYGTGDADCTACPANSESPEGTITIDGCLCKAGYAGSASDGCVACLYANDEYQPDAGQASCLTCDANASPTGDAAVACQCDPGYTGAAGSCSACGEGSYKASPGAEACTPCPANTESSAASTSVNDCECQAGTEAPANGQTCTECPTGEYKQATGAGDCISCGTGATTLHPRSDDPNECVPDAGYTGSAGGPFTECAVGFYKSSPGVASCSTCYAHSTTLGTGSTSIDACSCVQPAYADDADGLHVCDCGAGYYWDGAACVQCEANSFCIGGDTSTAVQTACSTIDANSVSPAGSDAADDCVCDVGFKQGATCEACSAGSYSDQVDSASCANCGANLNTYDTSSGYHTSQATTATGADAESDCLAVPNFYKSGTAGLACPSNTWTAGRVGTIEYGSGIVSEHCVCQAGHYYSGDVYTRSSSDGCSVCPAGSYCPGGVFDTDLGQWAVEWEAQLCTAGAGGSVDPAYEHLTSDGGATAISRDDCYCKAGYVGPNGQANGCNECAVGSYCPGGEVAANCPTGATSPAGSDEITDCVCRAGFYGPDGQDCFTCPAGSYCPGGTVVTTCPAGSSSLPGAESILACLCNAGFTGPNGGPCEACEVGKYKAATGPDPCTDCPSFTSSPTQSDELTDCTCVAGYTGPDGQSCVACNPGEYKDVTGSSACQACTANSMSEAGAPTADSCLCDPGYTGTGSGGCTICSANSFKETAGPASCDACPTHSTSPAGSDEAADCVCDAGYSGVNGGTCTACPPGKYCVQGEANPSSCPTNALTIEALSDHVSDCVCDLGYSGSINTITDQCLECNAGFYNDEYDGVCNQCTQHSSSGAGSTAATDCKCIPGATGADGGPCTLCAVGEYKVGSGSGSCSPCPQHSTSEAGSDALLDCRCQKGYTGPDGQACFPCNAGQYKDAVGNAACSTCPDFTQSPAGSDELTDCTCIDGYVGPDGAECGRECPPGFEPGPANLRCVGCAPGTYKPTEGDEECTACPAHADHNKHNQTSQLVCDCVQGFIKDEVAFAAGSVQCSGCPDGSFGNHNFENVCHQCYAMVDGVCSPYTGADNTHCPGICQVPAGYQVTASGNNLELCPVGTYNLGGSTLQCQACPAGSLNADVVGATSLAACLCLPGYARTDQNAACQPCGAGTYKDSSDVAGVGGMGTCSACPADSSSLAASDALTDCRCNAGFTGADGGVCTECGAGTYKTLVGSSECVTCPDHSSSPAESTARADCVCDAGSAGPDGGPCVLCGIGSFSDTAGVGACTSCGSDTTTQSTGSDARSDCLCATGFEGHPTDGGPTTMSGSCVPSCAAGQTYSDADGGCVACAADTYKVATGAHTCTACADPRNASAVGSDELADCTCREGEMGLFGPSVGIITALGSYNLPRTHAGSPASIAAADAHRLKDITFTGMAGAGVTVTVAHSGTTLTLFTCEPRDCVDKTVELYGLRGTLSVTVTAGSPAWSVDVWEGRDWTMGTVDGHSDPDATVVTATTYYNAALANDISAKVMANDLTVGDHIFMLEDGAHVYAEPDNGSEQLFFCAPCPPGVICGAPVPYP